MALLLKRHRYLVDRRRADVNDENGDCVLFKVIGQTANPEKISRTAEREARRQRRRLNRKESGHKEGQSSDEEAGDEENSMYLADRRTSLQQHNNNVAFLFFCFVEIKRFIFRFSCAASIQNKFSWKAGRYLKTH